MSVIIAVIGGLFLLYSILMLSGIYQIKEGNVGLIKKFGVLQKDLIEPGIHLRIPGYEQVIHMNLMIQTDKVSKVPCGTANGLLIYFDKIEVVNRLDRKYVYKTVLNYTQSYEKIWITDKVHHEINQFCSKHTLQQIYIDLFDKLDEQITKALDHDLQKWAPGIQILSIRVTKPTIPKAILQSVQLMQKLKVQYLIAIEKENVQVAERKTNQTQQKIKAQALLQVKKIQLQKLLDRKKNELQMGKIESKIIFQKEKTLIDIQFLSAFEESALYNQLFTTDYLKFLSIQSLTSNLTLTLGGKVPNIMGDMKSFKKK